MGDRESRTEWLKQPVGARGAHGAGLSSRGMPSRKHEETKTRKEILEGDLVRSSAGARFRPIIVRSFAVEVLGYWRGRRSPTGALWPSEVGLGKSNRDKCYRVSADRRLWRTMRDRLGWRRAAAPKSGIGFFRLGVANCLRTWEDVSR